jgi:hypothetical protein
MLVTSVSDWIVFGLFGAFLILALVRGVKTWSLPESRRRQSPPAWWFWGSRLWRGWIRSMPFGVFGGGLWFAAGIGAAFLQLDQEAHGFAVPVWYAVGFISLTFAWIATWLSIIVFNRPKALVPPRFRAEPGALIEWWEARRRR